MMLTVAKVITMARSLCIEDMRNCTTGNDWTNRPVPDRFERVDKLLDEHGVEPRRLPSERDIAITKSSMNLSLSAGQNGGFSKAAELYTVAGGCISCSAFVSTAERSCSRASVIEKARTAMARQASSESFDSALRSPVFDRSAKRFAQDDGFVGGLNYRWMDMQKTRKDRKSRRLSG
jgi:hypothetical protein